MRLMAVQHNSHTAAISVGAAATFQRLKNDINLEDFLFSPLSKTNNKVIAWLLK